MSRFSAEWLQLREPADTASRSAALLQQLSQQISQHHPLRVVDLGAGTGANLRYMAPRLSGEQHWLLMDSDAELLGLLPQRLTQWSTHTGFRVEQSGDLMVIHGPDFECQVRSFLLDLSCELDKCELAGQSLITASALLDLVSESWLRDLAARCYANGVVVCFALTYDGRLQINPAASLDQRVRELVNRHQHGDKGFGAALGPQAVGMAKQIFGELGYEVRSAPSDWFLGPDQQTLQARLIEGWLQAATEMGLEETRSLLTWQKYRRGLIDNLNSSIQVGHQDLVGWLP